MRSKDKAKSSARHTSAEEPTFLIFVQVYSKDPSVLYGFLAFVLFSIAVILRVILSLIILQAVSGAMRDTDLDEPSLLADYSEVEHSLRQHGRRWIHEV